MASLVYSVQTSAPQFLSTLPLFEFSSVGRTIAASDDIFYAVFLHVCTFYLVAFISGYLVEKLRLKEGELSSTSRRLERARLDTDDILLNLHSGILTIDNHGDIVYFNRAAESILGLKETDVRGRSFMQAFDKRMPEFTERILSVLKLAKPSIRTEIEIIDEDGAVVPIGLTTSMLGDEKEGIRGVIAVFQDLTSAKKLENALMNANRLAAVGEISARIAHEIRNPLASISGSVEVLKSELQLADENQRLMDLIVKESERLSRILTNFLSYARNQPTVRSKIELISLVGETVELLRHDTALPDCTELAFRPEIATAYVVADEDQLKQVIINLITNAAEAIEHPGGKVEVVISEPSTWPEVVAGEWIELQVIDNGQGFAPEDKARVFEPFYSGKKGGTGLGLAIVRRCLDNLGARIKVDTSPGLGTTFSIILRRYLATSDQHKQQPQIVAQE
jgi:two-component system sensor histidine kinase PilS (NtrC family)